MPELTASNSVSQGPIPPKTALDHPPQARTDFWTFRDLFLFLAFAFPAFFVSYLLVLSGFLALKPLVGWHTPLSTLGDSPFFLLALQTVFYGFVLGYVYLLVVVSYRQPFWQALKWKNPPLHETVRLIMGGILLALLVQFVPTVLPEKQTFPLERLFSSPTAAYAMGAFAVLVAPFMEELIFRGVLFSILERQVGLSFAVVSTAVLFAGLHVPEYWQAWNHVLMILIVGVVFSLARGLTGSLAPSVFLHFAYNASQMAALFLETQGFRTLHGFLVR